MSSFKKLSKADVTNVPYRANKQWDLSYACFSDNVYFNVYKGTYITGTFSSTDPSIDPITNGQYERLIFDSMNHLFYQSYSGSLLDTGSIMFDINTYESASQQRPTGSYFDYNINPLLVKHFLEPSCIKYLIINNTSPTKGLDYIDCSNNPQHLTISGFSSESICAISYTPNTELITIPEGIFSEIRVLSINQDIYGSKILPHYFRISSSLYNIVDDGNGNLFDIAGYEDDYVDLDYILQAYFDDATPNVGIIHIGNIFYAHGIVVITNPDYQEIFPLPPLALNDNATFITTDTPPFNIDILSNDIARSCPINQGSVILSGSNAIYYTDNGDGTITLNTTEPGNYDVYYTVNSMCDFESCPLTSNQALVSVNVLPNCSFTISASVAW